MAKKFTSAAAFKASLEDRIRARAKELAVPFQTLQLKFVIERLLARLFHEQTPPWLLKGGFAMDLRFRLQAAADLDLGDFFRYRIGEMQFELVQAPGGGRFPCEAVMLGKTYARFQIDVGLGDPLVGEPEELIGDELLEFAGIEPARVLAIPKAQQFAEKLHAYTFPWEGRLNTRTKDLVDLVLLIERGPPDAEDVRRALQATFAGRSRRPSRREGRTPCRRRSPRRRRSGRRTSPAWRRRRASRPSITSKPSPYSTAIGARTIFRGLDRTLATHEALLR